MLSLGDHGKDHGLAEAGNTVASVVPAESSGACVASDATASREPGKTVATRPQRA
jgi:hypothetical protein